MVEIMTTEELKPELLKSDYVIDSKDKMIEVLKQYLLLYSLEDHWELSQGEAPHCLRQAMYLDFHPNNVEHGYVFAQEALEKLET